MKILWLASWYPNRTEPLTGDFIQRHAQAVSLYHDVYVIHVVRDSKKKITYNVLNEKTSNGGLKEEIIYYYSRRFYFSFFNRLCSYLKYKRVFKKSICEYISHFGKPDLIHVHTGMKAGLLAKWIAKKEGIPYVVSEHWTGFLPESEYRFKDIPFNLRNEWEIVLNQSSGISVVSDYLASNLQKVAGGNLPIIVIPNVVNTAIFNTATMVNNDRLRICHVSGLDFQKNPESIIEAFSILRQSNFRFHVDIFGPIRQSLISLTHEFGLTDDISFHGEVSQCILAKTLKQADLLVLYSRYETFGCVVIEANACGIPVIVSDIPVMHELVKEDMNGIIVKGENPEALAVKIKWFAKNRMKFDSENIAKECSEKYCYKTVGRLFSEWYQLVISKALF